jgi:hypothetical protein
MKKFLKLFGFLVAIVIFFYIFDAALMLWQLTPITTASKYNNVMTLRWHDQSLIEHFPGKIPSDAKNTRFYYRAGFLQGGSSIELRVKMPTNFVEEVLATYKQKAKAVFNGAEKLDRGTSNPDMLPKWSFITYPPDENETPGTYSLLPKDFKILLLSSEPYKSNPTDWNHGKATGISISRQRREIIYWAEDW